MRNLQKEQPKLEEILEWIKNKVEIYGVNIANIYNADGTFSQRVIDKANIQSFEGHLIIIKMNNLSDGNNNIEVDLSKLSLEITMTPVPQKSFLDDSEGSYVMTEKEMFMIMLYSLPNQNGITHILKDKKKYLLKIGFEINDKNMAERIVKAFHDAIELCGGKPELY